MSHGCGSTAGGNMCSKKNKILREQETQYIFSYLYILVLSNVISPVEKSLSRNALYFTQVFYFHPCFNGSRCILDTRFRRVVAWKNHRYL